MDKVRTDLSDGNGPVGGGRRQDEQLHVFRRRFFAGRQAGHFKLVSKLFKTGFFLRRCR